MKVFLLFVFGLGWSVYLGGALVMAWVWRPLQKGLPPGQTGILCLKMGRIYKYLALVSLGLVAVSWAILGLIDHHGVLIGSNGVFEVGVSGLLRGIIGAAVWLALVGFVLFMGVFLHPSSHVRAETNQGEAGREKMKEMRLKSISRMNKVLKAELATALVATLIMALSSATVIPGGH
ncbi:MAG: hypothetical protein HKL80_03830 [Acidimicrobiales bacterium]|nr:hypothetical protein [Acidimicrobiales bacterium]